MLFIHGLRSEFAPARQFITETMAPYNGPYTINEAAPLSLSPERLLLSLQQHAMWLSNPKLCITSARDFKSSFRTPRLGGSDLVVRQIDLDGSLDPLAALSISEEQNEALLVHAVTQRPKGCFFCQADDHPVRDCPRFAKLKTNTFGLKSLRRLLDNTIASSASPARIHELSTDVDLPSLDEEDSPGLQDFH
jgi:hypothetical protein